MDIIRGEEDGEVVVVRGRWWCREVVRGRWYEVGLVERNGVGGNDVVEDLGWRYFTGSHSLQIDTLR
jgi:hypothetical protein